MNTYAAEQMPKAIWADQMETACDEPERELDCVRAMIGDVRRAASDVERFVSRFHGIGKVCVNAEKEPPPCGYSGELRALRKVIDELSKQVSSLASIG